MNRIALAIATLMLISGLGVVHFSLANAQPGVSPELVHGGPDEEHTPTPTNSPTPTAPFIPGTLSPTSQPGKGQSVSAILVHGCSANAGSIHGGPNTSYLIPANGKFTMLLVRVASNTLNGDTEIMVMVNGEETPLTTTIPAGSDAYEAISEDVPIRLGDLVNLRTDASSSTDGFFGPCGASLAFR